jgi:hypothetical protein
MLYLWHRTHILLYETQFWEDNFACNIVEVNIVHEQEREVQQWMNAGQLKDTNAKGGGLVNK